MSTTTTAVAVAASCELADALPWHVWHTKALPLCPGEMVGSRVPFLGKEALLTCVCGVHHRVLGHHHLDSAGNQGVNPVFSDELES